MRFLTVLFTVLLNHMQLASATELDGEWKVVAYKCDSQKFKSDSNLHPEAFTSFLFDVPSRKAILTIQAGDCLQSGELELEVDRETLHFSNYRPLTNCSDLEAAEDFSLMFKLQSGPPEELKLLEAHDDVCIGESASEVVLRKTRGS